MTRLLVLILMCHVVGHVLGTGSGKKRNIIFIAADDLGWNDVGFQNVDMITPNIDRLAYQGVILNSSYVQPTCTPSRHAWMTGVYPFKSGMQRRALFPFEGNCSPLDLTFFPERLQKLGYSTHMVGKWHLGGCKWNCTPTYRGFDTFYGFLNGKEDYYTKTLLNGIDFFDGETPVNDTTYSTYLYNDRVQQIIETHNDTEPFFLYYSFQNAHNPIQVPKRFEDMYPNLKTETRRQYSGMVTAMDEAIGNLTDILEKNNLMNDTLIIFTSDNGGWPKYAGNNWPLRGGKTTLFEGGTRAIGFVVGNGLENTGYTYDGLIHAVDWHPTIVAAAGGDLSVTERDAMDGINQWESIISGNESRRNEFVYNLDNEEMAPNGHAAIRVGKYKLIDGYPGPDRGWYKPDQVQQDTCDSSDDFNVTDCLAERDAMKRSRDALKPFKEPGSGVGVWAGEGLYDLSIDPNERNDISLSHPNVVEELRKKLDEYRKSLGTPTDQTPIPASNPDNYGGYWMPGWC